MITGAELLLKRISAGRPGAVLWLTAKLDGGLRMHMEVYPHKILPRFEPIMKQMFGAGSFSTSYVASVGLVRIQSYRNTHSGYRERG